MAPIAVPAILGSSAELSVPFIVMLHAMDTPASKVSFPSDVVLIAPPGEILNEAAVELAEATPIAPIASIATKSSLNLDIVNAPVV
jgi:hypothetical protein